MRITRHAIIAVSLLSLGVAMALPQVLALEDVRDIPVERLSVPSERARPPLVTADRALGAVVQAQAGMPMGNPFSLRERGRISQLPVPEPPPPLLALPEPPLTPFAPASR
jgi:hypothetical protein